MKNLIFILIIIWLTGCAKNPFDQIEVEKVWQKPDISLNKLKKTILENKNGWEFLIQNKSNNSLHYGYINFTSETNTEFISDFAPKYYKLNTSEIKLDSIENNSGIIFPPKSTFAQLINETNFMDSIYVVKSIGIDTIIFEGETTQSKLTFYKADEKKKEEIKNNKIAISKNNLAKVLKMPKFFFYLEYAGTKIDLDIDTLERTFNLRKNIGNKLDVEVIRYYFDGQSLRFNTPININGKSFSTLEVKSTSNTEAILNDGLKITNHASPVFYDLSAIKVLEGTTISFAWGSRDGVCNRNAVDLTKLKNINNFDRLIIFPKYDTDTITKKDFGFMGIFLRGEYAGTTERPQFIITADNLMKLVPYRTVGTPPTDNNIIETNKLLLPFVYNPKGFYVIQMRNGFYLVDARDALTWIYFNQAMS